MRSSRLALSSEASVSLASIGNCEIRMFRGPDTDLTACTVLAGLFNHSAKTSVDGFSCQQMLESSR